MYLLRALKRIFNTSIKKSFFISFIIKLENFAYIEIKIFNFIIYVINDSASLLKILGVLHDGALVEKRII